MELNEKYIDRNVADISRAYDLEFALSKLTGRICVEIIDGLKVVARRTLYIMYLKDQGKTFRKVAAITGDTIARVHMHGQSSVTACLVGMGQWWNNSIPLIEGQGNFGGVDGSEAAADRYILAKLSPYAYDCFFSDWKESIVDMRLGDDGETMEPLYLPSKYPNILLNGSLGIGYGVASNIPPFNFREVVEATIKLMEDPEADILLIPDSPTGADIVGGNFRKIVDIGNGVYSMRCTYEIIDNKNLIKITSVPYQVTVNTIRERIAQIKEGGGFPELIGMNDYTRENVDLRLTIRDDVNPYKFLKKLIDNVGGLEKSYPVNIVVTDDYQAFDYSIKKVLVEWIRYRREQKRVVINHKRTTILAEQRTNDVKIFLMSGNNLQKTINIFKSSRNKSEIEACLIETYRSSEIRMDSLQARTLSELRMHELSIDAYEKCLRRRDELVEELKRVEDILGSPKGVDQVIVSELREGLKKYGKPRRSNVVPYKISTDTEVSGNCILQLSSDGTMLRKKSTNVEEEPVPIDSNGFAVQVGNDCAFIAIDENGFFSFIKVKEIPVDQEVPLNRFVQRKLGEIIALLPHDVESNKCCVLISKLGMIKRILIDEIKPSKHPLIELSEGDTLVKGIVVKRDTTKDLLIYTSNGLGQRLDPNQVRITSSSAKGGNGFKLSSGDEIVGCYSLDPNNEYLLYVTLKGKVRLNQLSFLPTRDSKKDEMVRLISLADRDHLLAVVGCNRLDQLQVFFSDGEVELIDINKLPEGTMATEPKKVTRKNMVTSNIIKVKLV